MGGCYSEPVVNAPNRGLSEGKASDKAAVSLAERRRRLSANNEDSKLGIRATARSDSNAHMRRRLSIIGVKTDGDNVDVVQSPGVPSPSSPWGSAGLGDGAEAICGEAEVLPIVWAACSRPGNDPLKRQKENQDAYCVHDKFAGATQNFCVCVYDGHGPNGALASDYVRNNLYKCWASKGIATAQDTNTVHQILHQGCVDTNAELAMSDIDCFVSGSTGILGVFRDNMLHVANVGDSRAVLARVVDGKLTAVDLSNDHKPDRPDEEKRIVESGGRVFEWGVPRVWRKDIDMPGLAMARSFGDLAAESVGVFAEPEISTTSLTSEDCFVVFATDGLWEFLSSQDVVDVIGNELIKRGIDTSAKGSKANADFDVDPSNAVMICSAAIKRAVKEWNMREDVVDDTTCVVLFLKYGAQK